MSYPDAYDRPPRRRAWTGPSCSACQERPVYKGDRCRECYVGPPAEVVLVTRDAQPIGRVIRWSDRLWRVEGQPEPAFATSMAAAQHLTRTAG